MTLLAVSAVREIWLSKGDFALPPSIAALWTS